MSAPNAPIVKPEVVFIEDLLDEIANGKLRVPPFQRPFIWKPSDMLALFDSIYKGYPIGSLLLWESTEELESLDYVGPPIPIPRPSDIPLTYILDGHQRLATLYGGLRIPSDFSLDTKQENWQWWIWYDLKELEFIHVTNHNPDPWLLPLRAVLRTTDFLEAARKLQENCPDNASEFIIEAEQVAQKVKNYRVAIISIKGGNLEQAVESFSRLNSLGRLITPDQMVSALTYSEKQKGFNLAQRIDEILEHLSDYHFDNIKRQTVLRAISAAAGMETHTSDWESLAKKLGQNARAVDDAEEALVAAGRFLYETLKVPGDRLLPYTNQILLLSEFFRHCSSPDKQQEDILKRWFWVTSLSGWFAGASNTQVNKGLHGMRELAQDKITTLQMMSLNDPARPFPNSFDMRSSRVRALLLFTLTLEPLDPATAEHLEAGQILNEHGNRALLYVFPRAKGSPLSNPANRILLERKPGQSAKEQLLSINPQKLDEILESHGITHESYEALRENDARGFIEARAQHLAKIEREFMEEIGVTPPTETGFGEADIDTDEVGEE